ncbi:hypothetical protein Tco_1148164 [Tanacetum coccineum]
MLLTRPIVIVSLHTQSQFKRLGQSIIHVEGLKDAPFATKIKNVVCMGFSIWNFLLITTKDLIVLSSDNSTDEDMNKGPSVAKVPKEGPSVASVPIEGPSIRKRPYVGPELAKVFKAGPPPALLEWFGYSTVDEYLEDTFFDSTDNDTTDNNIMDDYISDVFDSPKSKAEGECLPVGRKASQKVIKNKNAEDTNEGKYVPVGKNANQKVIFKSLVLVTGCVLGLANGKTWDQIIQKVRNRKSGNSTDKGKGKAKV